MALYLKITMKNLRFNCVISYWHAFGSLLSAHLGPVLLNSVWFQTPSCCLTHILILPSCPSPMPFSSPWFIIQLLWIWVFSFHAPRKEVKEKHSALNFKAWVHTPVHTSSEQNLKLCIRRATLSTSMGFVSQAEVITTFQASFWKQEILSI